LVALAKHSQGSLEIIKSKYALYEGHAKRVDLQSPERWPRGFQKVTIRKLSLKNIAALNELPNQKIETYNFKYLIFRKKMK
jgi:hypothetical protein